MGLIKAALCLLLLAPAATYAQGVQFNDKLSWSKILAKAKAEDKYIFMDCFTTWCGPCRMMRSMLLTQPAAASYFNEKFICVSVQLDTTTGDDHRVRSWYEDAHALQQQYDVFAFPTFLIFAPDGHPLHRVVGGRKDIESFITSVDESFDTTRQYYTKLREFQEGRRDKEFLLRMTNESARLYDDKNHRLAFQAYLDAQGDFRSYSPCEYLVQHTKSTRDPGFPILLEKGALIDSVLGPGKAEAHVIQAIANDYIARYVRSQNEPSWSALHEMIAGQYPDQAEEVIAYGKIMYYEVHQDWPSFQDAVTAYIGKYSDHAIPETLNSYALSVFRYCPDQKCNLEAIAWSKRAVDNKATPFFMGTYARLLYKMGNKDEALVWITKARDIAGVNAKQQYQDALDKMEHGEQIAR